MAKSTEIRLQKNPDDDDAEDATIKVMPPTEEDKRCTIEVWTETRGKVLVFMLPRETVGELIMALVKSIA